MKAIVATGFGKLHFHETARALAAAGVEVNFLTGWVPKDNQTALVNRLGNLLGERNLARRMAARQIRLPGVSVTPVAWVEVAGTFIRLIQRTRVIPLDLAYGLEFRIAAWGSRKYLHHADVLLVRSGAGQSGAIRRARQNGMAIVTDHSIAHPAFLHSALRDEFARFGLPAGYDPRADLWKLVLRDCADADLLLVNSEFVKRTFVEQGYPECKVRVAYLGVREEFFDLKRDYRIDGPVHILFTGNFDVRKGVRILLEAIRSCRRSGLDVRLQLMGNLDNGAGCLETGDKEFFTHTAFAPLEQVAAAFAASDLFVFPTFAEGSSRAGMEAAAAGLPIITTKNCGLPLEHGKSVIYVPVNDAESLAEAIGQLAVDEKLRRSIGRAAMTTVTESYTWLNYGRKVAGHLKEAVEARALRR
ncbi:MAG TPA: glycosyltransferase family 4 protein [Acidobacteriaceae bacterium]|nr:glycosyltransferase family 4 protein [Acidobacteriaceae bacterium]